MTAVQCHCMLHNYPLHLPDLSQCGSSSGPGDYDTVTTRLNHFVLVSLSQGVVPILVHRRRATPGFVWRCRDWPATLPNSTVALVLNFLRLRVRWSSSYFPVQMWLYGCVSCAGKSPSPSSELHDSLPSSCRTK